MLDLENLIVAELVLLENLLDEGFLGRDGIGVKEGLSARRVGIVQGVFTISHGCPQSNKVPVAPGKGLAG